MTTSTAVKPVTLADFSKCLTAAVNADKAAAKVSDTLLALFKAAGFEAFDEHCQSAEAKHKAKEVKANREPLIPRSWTQAKSDLKAAHKAGVNIDECTSVSQAKNLKIKANAAAKAAADGAKADVKKPAKAKGAGAPTVSMADAAMVGDKATKMRAKLELLNDKLDASGLSYETIEALLDSFSAQVDKAISVSKAADDVVQTTPAKTKSKASAKASAKSAKAQNVTTIKAVS